MRISEFRRRHPAASDATKADAGADTTQLDGLGESLMQDLLRFQPERDAGHLLLEVLAASLRHGRAVQLHVQSGDRVIPLTVRPIERELDTPLPLAAWLGLSLDALRVLRVGPAVPRGTSGLGEPAGASPVPLAGLLWPVALRGARSTLLPEIAGLAVYRVAPGGHLPPADAATWLAPAVARLRRQAVPLREIAGWPGLGAERAARLLNGLYLQAALIVSRTHPSALPKD